MKLKGIGHLPGSQISQLQQTRSKILKELATMSQKSREEETSESQAVDYSDAPRPIIKRIPPGALDQVKKMIKEDEEEKEQVMQQLKCLQQQVWEAFEECEKKLRTMNVKADTNTQLLSEYFQEMYHFLQKLSLKSTENWEANDQQLADLSSAAAELLEEVTTKKPKNKQIPAFMERATALKAQLKELETMKGFHERCISPLQIHEWRGLRHVMKPAPDPLHFDPASANPYLNISTDLKQVKLQLCAVQRKDRKYCFEPGLYVLALPGFKSGTHYWEVDVGRKSNWIMGVVMRSVERKGKRELSPKNGYFVLRKQRDEEYYGTGSSPLDLKTSPIRIGVCLDLTRGRLAFYDADTSLLIYELHCPLHEELYAVFCPGVPTRVEDWRPMKLCS